MEQYGINVSIVNLSLCPSAYTLTTSAPTPTLVGEFADTEDFRLPLSIASVIFCALVEVFMVADCVHKGTDIITPFPVPIHNRLHDTSRAVMRTNEKPNFPVPETFGDSKDYKIVWTN